MSLNVHSTLDVLNVTKFISNKHINLICPMEKSYAQNEYNKSITNFSVDKCGICRYSLTNK